MIRNKFLFNDIKLEQNRIQFQNHTPIRNLHIFIFVAKYYKRWIQNFICFFL